MRDDLERYHGIDPSRVFGHGLAAERRLPRRRPRADYEALLAKLGLDPAKRVVLYAGNTPTNQPYEANTVGRLVDWWATGDGDERFQLLFRPHPRNNQVRARFAAASGPSRRGRPGRELHGPERPRHAAPARRLRGRRTAAPCCSTGSPTTARPSASPTTSGAPPGERWADLNLGGAAGTEPRVEYALRQRSTVPTTVRGRAAHREGSSGRARRPGRAR